MRRSFRALLAAGRTAIGTWAQIPHPEVIEILGQAGLDFAIVDLEHGHFGIERATELFRACDAVGLVALARVRGIGDIGAVLDAGAAAVVVPGIASRAEAEAAAAAARYAPRGTRGACPCVRAGGHVIADWSAHEDADEAGVILLVETRAGVEAIDQIVAVPGPLALMLGPFDLSVSLGHRGDWRHPEVGAALERLAAAARGADLPLIAPVFDRDHASAAAAVAAWRASGIRIITIGTDKLILGTAVSSWVGVVT
ncbi:HpcH/HpaI aldolase family protein [Elioraea sp.]|uniref:HpcH/HpaI aldolase family protein n=1 Tax=Elioraea sp. TaxID=2185103 RepID=UPI003F6E741D